MPLSEGETDVVREIFPVYSNDQAQGETCLLGKIFLLLKISKKTMEENAYCLNKFNVVGYLSVPELLEVIFLSVVIPYVFLVITVLVPLSYKPTCPSERSCP